MSSYTVSTVRLARSAMHTAFSELLTAAEGTSSGVLYQACGNSVGRSAAALDRRWAAVNRLPGGRQLLELGATAELDAADRWTREVLQADACGDSVRASLCASEANTALETAVTATVRALRRDERSAVTRAASRALGGLGYHVAEAHGKRSTGLWATREHEIVAVLVQDGGAMELDMAGLSGGSCAASAEAFEAALAREGVIASVLRRIDHGDAAGGSLIRRAGQTGASRREEGLVLQHEIGPGSPTDISGRLDRQPVVRRHTALRER